MKIGIMQPYFFPYIGYWQLINCVDNYVIYDDVNYIKGGWINRNNIALNGNKHLITLPLVNSSSFKPICEIEVTKDEIAKNKILKTIENAYRNAPYFNEVMPMIASIIAENSTISYLNYCAIKTIADYLNIDTKLILSSDMDKNSMLKGEEKVIDICKRLGATKYINAIGGVELYNKERFRQDDLTLQFLRTKDICYRQLSQEFIPNLSIIDIMMCCSVDKIQDLLNGYELI